jgi:hypothetical protein
MGRAGQRRRLLQIPGVPDGNYFLAYWDEKLHYILDFVQVTVSNGQMTDVGIRMLTGWFTEVYGTVFHDVNENGRRDPGEPGIPHYVVVLKDRDNTEIDRMSIAALLMAPASTSSRRATPWAPGWCWKLTATCTAPPALPTRP